MRRMKDSGIAWIGEIPEGWETRKTKQIFSVFNGSTPKSDNEEYWGGGIIWITPAEMGDHIDLIKDSKRRLTSLGLSACGTTIVPANSIIISSRAPIGQVAISGLELCTNQGCKSLVKKYNINEKYFFYFFRIQSETLNMLGKGTTFLELSSFELENFLIPAPPIPEQHRIADYLDAKCAEIDRSMELVRQGIDKLKAYRMSAITEAVTKGLAPDVPMKDSGVPWIGEIPEGWKVRRLKTISNSIVVGIVINPSQYMSEDGLPYIYGGDIQDGKINFTSCRKISKNDSLKNKKTILSSNDILTVRVGYPGISAVVPKECEGGNCASVILTRKGNFNSWWYCYCLNSKIIKAQIDIVKYGAAQEQFNLAHMLEFSIPVPPLSEQHRIAAYLDAKCAEIDAIIARKQELLDKLAAYKKSLIFECVTGKREVAA